MFQKKDNEVPNFTIDQLSSLRNFTVQPFKRRCLGGEVNPCYEITVGDGMLEHSAEVLQQPGHIESWRDAVLDYLANTYNLSFSLEEPDPYVRVAPEIGNHCDLSVTPLPLSEFFEGDNMLDLRYASNGALSQYRLARPAFDWDLNFEAYQYKTVKKLKIPTDQPYFVYCIPTSSASSPYFQEEGILSVRIDEGLNLPLIYNAKLDLDDWHNHETCEAAECNYNEPIWLKYFGSYNPTSANEFALSRVFQVFPYMTFQYKPGAILSWYQVAQLYRLTQ